MKKWCFTFGILPFSLDAAAPESYTRESAAKTWADFFWYKASHEVSASLFYQQTFGDDLTYFDATFLGYYATGRLYGFKAAAGLLVAAPIFVATNGTSETYNDVKQIFLFNTIYGDYINEKLKLSMIAGRYKAKEEWNTFYSQGFGITYDGFLHTSLNLTASYGSAMVIDEFVTPFRTDLSSFGTYFLRGTFELPYHIELQPYVYATGFFTAFGMKAQMAYHVAQDVEMETKLHILGYSKYYAHTFPANVNHKFELAAEAGLANQNMAGIAWLEQELIYLDLLEAKVGVIGTSQAGAELIDYYGHTTPFEYNVGMFWGNAVTIYGATGFNWNHIFEIEAGVRGSFLPTGNIVSFEIKGLVDFPIWRQRVGNQYRTFMKGKLGLSAIGVYNDTPAINFYGGNNYTLLRAFIRISI
ncbi:hypothetical protein CQA53_00585 [Helicobacter didelphidarum]|uniref:Outer membrane family protein n=1 Tax=Helicobacter didelphidarum TaxID=2040648 RepID=A0A3D8IQY0_9HELI|nr:hypothetical protein CQA53_00585 [Helicobacter didelphidarum]